MGLGSPDMVSQVMSIARGKIVEDLNAEVDDDDELLTDNFEWQAQLDRTAAAHKLPQTLTPEEMRTAESMSWEVSEVFRKAQSQREHPAERQEEDEASGEVVGAVMTLTHNEEQQVIGELSRLGLGGAGWIEKVMSLARGATMDTEGTHDSANTGESMPSDPNVGEGIGHDEHKAAISRLRHVEHAVVKAAGQENAAPNEVLRILQERREFLERKRSERMSTLSRSEPAMSRPRAASSGLEARRRTGGSVKFRDLISDDVVIASRPSRSPDPLGNKRSAASSDRVQDRDGSDSSSSEELS